MSTPRRYPTRKATTGGATRTPQPPPVSAAIKDAGVELPTDHLHGTQPRIDNIPDVVVRLEFPAPAEPVSINTWRKWFRLKQNDDSQLCKAAADEAATLAAADLAPLVGYRIEITVGLPVAKPRRRDGDNWVPVLKPPVDGITKAGVLIPDDDTTWLTRLHPVFGKWNRVYVRLRVATVEPWNPLEDRP